MMCSNRLNTVYKYEESPPLYIPITVMRGSQDNVTRADALKWRDETRVSFSLLEFEGGHFFIFRYAARIVKIFLRGMLPLFKGLDGNIVR